MDEATEPGTLGRLCSAVERWWPASGNAHAEDLIVARLSGGVIARSWRVTYAGCTRVVRLGESRRGALGVAVEGDVARAAAEAGLAPAVVGGDHEGGALVTEFRIGAAIPSPARMREPAFLSALASHLRGLHRLDVRPRAFDPVRYAADYGAADGSPLAAEFVRLARAYTLRFPNHCLCHNDLIASNLLEDEGIWFIDFEYAVWGSPILDLAGFMALNKLDFATGWQLVEAYYALGAIPFSRGDLAAVMRLVRLMGYFWALAMVRDADDPAPYLRYAAAILEDV